MQMVDTSHLMQQLRHHGVGHMIVDLLAQEDDAVVQQAAVDVVAALAAGRLLDNVGDKGVAGGLDTAAIGAHDALDTFDAH